jgi:hypothetical protein
MSHDLNDLDPELRMRWHCVVRDYHQQYGNNPEVRVTTVYRSEAEQAALPKGIKKAAPGKSLHQYRPCRALDFSLIDSVTGYVRGETPHELGLYARVGHLAIRYGLEWAGTWATGIDPSHVQCRMYTWQMAKAGLAPAWSPMPAEAGLTQEGDA